MPKLNKLVKKIAICTGFTEPENEGESRQPIWTQAEIGVKAENVVLSSAILGQTNLNSILNNLLPNQTFQNIDSILALDEYGKIYDTGIPTTWLNQMYADWIEQHENPDTPDQPEEEPAENSQPNNNQEPNNENVEVELEPNNEESEEP